MEQVYRIGIDHGYGNIKTAHYIFESSIIQRESVSELAGMVVEYEGKFYEIGSTHKECQMDKVWDEDYYILTLPVWQTLFYTSAGKSKPFPIQQRMSVPYRRRYGRYTKRGNTACRKGRRDFFGHGLKT